MRCVPSHPHTPSTHAIPTHHSHTPSTTTCTFDLIKAKRIAQIRTARFNPTRFPAQTFRAVGMVLAAASRSAVLAKCSVCLHRLHAMLPACHVAASHHANCAWVIPCCKHTVAHQHARLLTNTQAQTFNQEHKSSQPEARQHPDTPCLTHPSRPPKTHRSEPVPALIKAVRIAQITPGSTTGINLTATTQSAALQSAAE